MQKVRPIVVNPGGRLDPADIVGREADLEHIIRTLTDRSVVLTGERRMGKTSLARLVADRAASNEWTVVQQSAEGLDSLDALADELISRFEAGAGKLSKVGRALREMVTVSAGPLNVDPSRRSVSLEQVVSAAVEGADGRLLLVLDELPLFARRLNQGDSESGTEALHLLRRLREHHPGLRMLCLGSVGFHHVIRDSGSGVLNDTERIRLSPLDPDDATYLAECLLLGTDLDAAPGVAQEIAAAVEGVPYYVHRVVEHARREGTPLVAGAAAELVASALTAPDDPWDLRHYRDRIKPYFGEDAALARTILDALAAADEPLDFDALAARVGVSDQHAGVDPAHLHEMIERLEDDHYLVRDGTRRRFAFDLVRRAWIELHR